jgi:putative hydrolase of HD superfamily
MKTKAENPVNLLATREVPAVIRAYFELNHLKQLYRQGWLNRGISEAECETVAEHSFATAILALWLAQINFPDLDQGKVVQMALIHDLGEIYAGDIIPADAIDPLEKHRCEANSLQRMLIRLPNGLEIMDLWNEFEQGESREAQLVKQADKLEMGLQAEVYRLQGKPQMQEFLESARQSIEEPLLLELLNSLSEEQDLA